MGPKLLGGGRIMRGRLSVLFMSVIMALLMFSTAFTEANVADTKNQFGFLRVSIKSIIDARQRGENIYQKLVPDFDNIPEEKRESVAIAFNKLYTAEQEIVNKINMRPISEDSFYENSDFGIRSYYEIPIGENRNLGMYFGTGNGNSGGWALVPWLQSNSYNINNPSIKTDNSVSGTGNSWAWAVLERRIKVTGSGTQSARFAFGPIYYNQRLRDSDLGVGNVKIKVELWDVTSSPVTLLREDYVLNVNSTPFTTTYSGSPSKILYHHLQAGRTYAVRLVQEGNATAVGGSSTLESLGWTTKMNNLWLYWY